MYGSKFSWDNVFVNFDNTLCITIILVFKSVLVLHACVLQLWIVQGSVQRAPCHHQMEKFPVATSFHQNTSGHSSVTNWDKSKYYLWLSEPPIWSILFLRLPSYLAWTKCYSLECCSRQVVMWAYIGHAWGMIMLLMITLMSLHAIGTRQVRIASIPIVTCRKNRLSTDLRDLVMIFSQEQAARPWQCM